MIYQIVGIYYEDNCADELLRDPVLSAILGKEALASQPALSRFFNRGRMENFIGEGKDGFNFASVSSESKVANANRLQLHVLVYNIFNWFRCLTLPKHMNKHLIDTVRLKLLKVAVKVVLPEDT